MKTDTRNPAKPNDEFEPEVPGKSGPYAELLQLARTPMAPSAFYRKALRCIARTFGSPYAALYVQLSAEVIQDDVHIGSGDPGFWKPTVQQFLTDSLAEGRPRARLLSARQAELRIALLTVPLFNSDGTTIGALALVVRLAKPDARRELSFLESLAALTSFVAVGVQQAPSRSAESASSQAPSQTLAKAATVDSPIELAFSLTNGLRNKLGCDQVALGQVRGRRVRLMSISGIDDIKKRSPGVVRLNAAMEECLDAGVPIAHQRDGGWSGNELATGFRIHKHWHEEAGGAAVASIPLRIGDEIYAILSLRRRPDDPFDAELIEQVRKTVEPFAAALRLLAQARRNVFRHAADCVSGIVKAIVSPGRIGAKVIAGVVVAALGWVCFGTLEYEVSTTAAIAPALVRHVATPFEAVLAAAHHVAGDRVKAGEVLCELDHEELDLQRSELLAELAVAEREKLSATATGTPVEARLADANERLLRAKLAIVERRIEQARVRSPLDGIVVAGDLRKRVGSVVSQGQPLFEIAPLSHWTLQIEVPESAASDMGEGLEGRFAAQARPEQTQEFQVTRVSPTAETRAARNVYIAEATVDIDADWIRPGMEGVAKVSVGRRPVWWVAFHGLIDYLRLNFWL